MGYGSGLAAGAAALWLATAGWPHAAIAQGVKSFESLKAVGGRFEIIAGSDAAQKRAATPVALTAPRAAELQPMPRAPVAPAAAKPDAPLVQSALPPAVAEPESSVPHHTLLAPADTLTRAPQPSAAAPDNLTTGAVAMAPAPTLDPINTGALPKQPPQPRTVLPMMDENMKIGSNRDVLMAEALRRARSSLEDFLTAAVAPPEGTSGFAVKVLVGPKETREALWLSALERRVQRNLLFGTSERWSGRLVNEPTESATLRVGDRISFETSEIRDWTYFSTGGRPLGNFTACALTAPEGRAKLADLTEKTGLDCGWIALVTRTATR